MIAIRAAHLSAVFSIACRGPAPAPPTPAPRTADVGVIEGGVLDATHDERVDYIKFDRVYSDGSCALVRVGGDFVMPTAKARRGKLCCCTGTEVFEKQNGRWVFVRRVREICG